MDADPRTLFCVGATKAGTSWLYDYLQRHPECHIRSIKELHFYDALEMGQIDGRIDTLTAQRAALQARLEAGGHDRWTRNNLARQIADTEDLLAVFRSPETAREAGYLAYLTAGRQGGALVGDLTPAYALLPPARLGHIARLLPGARFVYLMRDPVARLWSHVRMQAQRGAWPGVDMATKARRIMNRVVNKGQETHIAVRGDYKAAVTRLRAAVPAERLFVEFTERLLTGEGLGRLCRFLGIAPLAADLGRKVHAGPDLALADDQRDQARAFLAPQYAFAEAEFGPLPAAWDANRIKV